MLIIAAHPRSIDGGKAEIAAEAKVQRRAGNQLAEDVRYHERSAAERANARLKDELAGAMCGCAGMPRSTAT